MESSGIISRVEEPTEWCSGMVVVPKSDSRIQICIDLSKLNESVKREYYLMPAVDESLAKVCNAKIFSKRCQQQLLADKTTSGHCQIDRIHHAIRTLHFQPLAI